MSIGEADEDSTSAASDSNHESEEEETQPELSKDLIFGLLSVERRRRVLKYLADNGGHTTLSDVAEEIAARENDTEIRLLNSQQRKRVYVSLYQCHLPKLDDADVIDYDQSRGTIKRRPNANQLDTYLAVEPTVTTGGGLPRPGEGTPLRAKLATYLP